MEKKENLLKASFANKSLVRIEIGFEIDDNEFSLADIIDNNTPYMIKGIKENKLLVFLEKDNENGLSISRANEPICCLTIEGDEEWYDELFKIIKVDLYNRKINFFYTENEINLHAWFHITDFCIEQIDYGGFISELI